MKFYTPYRCPNCGETQFSKIMHPFEDRANEEGWQGCKWVICDTCNERQILPKNAIIRE